MDRARLEQVSGSSGGGGAERLPASAIADFSVEEPHPHRRTLGALPPELGSKTVWWILLLVPASFLAERLGLEPMGVFLVSGLAIIPIAALIADATETIAGEVGPTLGGLLNATFGNATEMIISLVALQQGLADMVKASITGTIAANLLLALGAGMLLGGLKHREQRFPSRVARINASSLNLALVVLMAPAAIHYTSSGLTPGLIDRFSLVAAVLLLVFYMLSLMFSMQNHRQLYELDEASLGDAPDREEGGAAAGQVALWRPVLVLLAGSGLLVFVSELLVDSLKLAITDMGLSELFIGVILIPLFGGMVEYLTVANFALKNKMDLAVAVAVGSSLQIAMFVAPVLVIVGHLMGKPMNLEFHSFELVAAVVAVGIANSISADGRCNWLEGTLLLTAYGVLGAAFYFHP
jgi:Ca2+:H+ antiporter